jgi:hypothetical protein
MRMTLRRRSSLRILIGSGALGYYGDDSGAFALQMFE